MPQEVDIAIDPDYIHDQEYIRERALKKGRLRSSQVSDLVVIRRSIDARKSPLYRLKVLLYKEGETHPRRTRWKDHYRQVSEAKKVHIVGAGPAGYFAALECLELGLCPIVIDRGKDVQKRRRDLRAVQQESKVNPDSNYCFGEGGAGTYSDGKLYTRSKKRGNVTKVLEILVEHGADEDILTEAHPHIGSNKLPKIIHQIRLTIESFGGQVHFERKLVDLKIANDRRLSSMILDTGEIIPVTHLILATGHSARDIYALLDRHGVTMYAKPFAIGVRIEHPQYLIDEMQYGQNPRHPNLPAAAYRLASTIDGTGVFSFCMCPGGLIVPASTAPGEVVVNGMSLSRRDSAFANAGIVVSVHPSDWENLGYQGVMGGLHLQQDLEQKFFELGDGSLAAPAQRVSDFLRGIKSKTLPSTSYIPGLISVAINEVLPKFLSDKLRKALFEFNRRMPGFVDSESVLVGLESRTSSPLRIVRQSDSLEHPDLAGLFPCGEGAGYAGGIVSAAIDGQLVARSIYSKIESTHEECH